MNEELNLTYLADNFDILVKEKIDTAPYAGYQIRFSGDELKLIQETRTYLLELKEKFSRGGRPRKWNSPEEKNAFHNAKRRTKPLAK